MRTQQLITLAMLAVALNLQSDVKEVTAESDISQKGYSIVKFYAEWCGPCRAFAPEFKELATKYADKGKFYSVNADTQSDILSKYGVSSLPTVAIFKDGKIEIINRTELEAKLKELKAPSKEVEVKKETRKRKLSVFTETKTVKKQKKSCENCNCDKK